MRPVGWIPCGSVLPTRQENRTLIVEVDIPVSDNDAKWKAIQDWVDTEERVTVDFLDEKGLSAAISECTRDHVDLLIQTKFPHLKQHISVPLHDVEVTEDRTKYTRDPDRPLRYGRLKLIIQLSRPQWV